MGKVSDIEQVLKTYLLTKTGVLAALVTGNIFLQNFPVTVGNDDKFLIRRDGTGNSPKNISIDTPTVQIWARHSNPHTAFTNLKVIGDLLHGIDPIDVTVSAVVHRILYGEMIAGPFRDDDLAKDIPQQMARFMIRVVVP